MIELLGHESNFQRHVALRALRLIGLEDGTSRVVGIALSIIESDEAPNVRAEAVRLVGSSGEDPRRVRDGLANAAAQDNTEYVHNEATNQLGTIA